VRGYRLPFRRAASPLRRENVLLVGDAAGLVDPLSGDGIYEAVVSARLAADAIAAGSLDSYAAGVERELGPLHAASWAAKHALDRFPRLAFTLARVPLTWPVIERIVRGELQSSARPRPFARAAEGAQPPRPHGSAGIAVDCTVDRPAHRGHIV